MALAAGGKLARVVPLATVVPSIASAGKMLITAVMGASRTTALVVDRPNLLSRMLNGEDRREVTEWKNRSL
jgi:hypothetical protein